MYICIGKSILKQIKRHKARSSSPVLSLSKTKHFPPPASPSPARWCCVPSHPSANDTGRGSRKAVGLFGFAHRPLAYRWHAVRYIS